MDKGLGPPPPPFTTGKWTRVAGPPNLHDLGAQGLPPPTLHDLQLDKGWGPRNPSRLGGGFQMVGWTSKQTRGWATPPTPICKWTGAGAQPFTTPPPTLHDLQMDKGWGPQPFTTCDWGPPNPSRLANLKFCLDKHWGLQTIERLSIFLRGPGAFHRSKHQ